MSMLRRWFDTVQRYSPILLTFEFPSLSLHSMSRITFNKLLLTESLAFTSVHTHMFTRNSCPKWSSHHKNTVFVGKSIVHAHTHRHAEREKESIDVKTEILFVCLLYCSSFGSKPKRNRTKRAYGARDTHMRNGVEVFSWRWAIGHYVPFAFCGICVSFFVCSVESFCDTTKSIVQTGRYRGV